MSTYAAIRIEGGLLSPDVLETITERDGQRPADFGIDGSRTVLDEAIAAWGDARHYWAAFRARLARQTGESPVTITREQWVIPLLEALGYRLSFQRRAAEIDGRRYSISHRAGEGDDAPPVHVVGHDEELGSRNPSRSSQMAPHALLQDYLNRSEHLWGVVTNGRVLRLLRDSTSFTRPTYVEFDLETMFTSGRLDEFLLFYRLAHRSRLPKGVADAPACLLERYHQDAIEEGGRIRDGLRDAVEVAIRTLGNGFLTHPRNEALRAAVDGGSLSPEGFYQELLYLIYRLLFLMVAEERNLLSDVREGDETGRLAYERYRHHLSMARLRALAEQPLSAPQRYDDLYLGLRALFEVLRDPRLCAPLGLAPLNGELFTKLTHLDDAYLNNRDLLTAVAALSFFTPKEERVRRRVNYGALDVEELGSVYESLLDLQPVFGPLIPGKAFDFVAGTERKSTGSYYTRPELVQELVESALVPVMEARLAATDGSPEAKQEALCDLTVCDPACGSGHFLLAAARRIGLELARVRSGDEEPSPEEVREGVRDAITHCVYGVDRNPLAVDLCKVALWIEGYAQGRPLTFLDYRIRCGDSLVGVFDLEVLRDGIPDEAYTPVAGDDRKLARDLCDRNRGEHGTDNLEGQLGLGETNVIPISEVLARRRGMLLMPEDTPEQVTRKRAASDTLRGSDAWRRIKTACDLWTAAFYAPLTAEHIEEAPTTADVRRALAGAGARPYGKARVGADPHAARVTRATDAATRLRFFHWPLEFPEVLKDRGGFDVVLGNPPWDMLQLDPQEFFATHDSNVANAPNMAARSRRIEALKEINRPLYDEFSQAQALNDKAKNFVHACERYPLTQFGRVNVASLFAEFASRVLCEQGLAGMVLPTGIATNSFTQQFFAHLVETRQLVSLYDFENREGLFPGVHRSYKFCLLTLAGRVDRGDGGGVDGRAMRFAFYLTHPRQLGDDQRRFNLTREDFRRINPNTRTCPIFRTRADAELTRKIYRRVPVLVNEETGENPWGVRFQLMFMMNTNSHLFRTREELEEGGYRLVGNRFVRGNGLPSPAGGRGAGGEGDVYLPLYEAKMIWQFDHRFSSYEGVDSRSSTHLPDTTEAQHADPCYQVLPWYWVAEEEVREKLRGWDREWLLGFRDVTNATNERTSICSLMPRVGVGNNLPLLMAEYRSPCRVSALVANLGALALDFVVRQKLGGTHMNFFYVEQFPVLPPSAYASQELQFVVPRTLELAYTAWDLKPFADDVMAEADEALGAAIIAQLEENGRATGGHRWESAPAWVDRSTGFPPFTWDADRRAVLRAELDASYARLYGLTEEELLYILDPQDVALAAQGFGEDFPGETFRVLKEKEIRAYGEYRTKRLVLEAWERLEEW